MDIRLLSSTLDTLSNIFMVLKGKKNNSIEHIIFYIANFFKSQSDTKILTKTIFENKIGLNIPLRKIYYQENTT